MMMMFGRGFLWWKKLERKAPLFTCASLLLHLLLESDRNRKTPYMDSALSASSFLKCSFIPTTSSLRYREKKAP